MTNSALPGEPAQGAKGEALRVGSTVSLRQLKERERRAMRMLIEKGIYQADYFSPSDGNEAISAPRDLEPKSVEHGFVHPGLIRGTPVFWYRTSYEYEEYDVDLPSRLLEMHEFDWEAAAVKSLPTGINRRGGKVRGWEPK